MRRRPLVTALWATAMIALLCGAIMAVVASFGSDAPATLQLPPGPTAVALYANPVVDVPPRGMARGVLVVRDPGTALAVKVRLAGTPAAELAIRLAGHTVPFLPSPVGDGAEAVAQIGPMPAGSIPFAVTAQPVGPRPNPQAMVQLEQVRLAWAVEGQLWLVVTTWLMILALTTTMILLITVVWQDGRGALADS